MSEAEVTIAFRKAMAAEGIVTDDPLIPDGHLHRVHVEGSRGAKRDGWYVLHTDGIPAGAFGSWRLGVSTTWRLSRPGVGAGAGWKEQIAEVEKRRDEHQARLRERARSKAARIWAGAKPAHVDHPYLMEKQVKPHSLRMSCGQLVVPVCYSDGVLHSLQFIARDGSKLFLAGGQVRGCFYLMGKPNGKLLVAEGYATAATIREATREAVAVAFNAGNLAPVANVLRQKFGHLPIVIAADDDHATPGNPGLTKAIEAAQGVGAKIAVPHFHDAQSRGTDFNDLASREGLEEANRQLSDAKESSEAALVYAEAVIAALGTKPPSSEIEKVVAVIAAVEGSDQQKFLTASLSNKLGRQMTKGDLWAAVRDRVTELGRQRAAAVEADRLARLGALKIDPAQLVAELETFFDKRMYLRAGAGLILALYVLNTWCFELFETVAYLLLTSPLPQCGKTRQLGLLGAVCARSKAWVSVSSAAMFRTIELYKPTVLVDQVEKLAAVDESSRELIAILESGYKRGATVPRMTGPNHDILREFSTYCPKVLACVGKLKGALLDRCIIMEQERKPANVRLRSARAKAIRPEADHLREACEAYALQWREELVRLYEEEPDEGYWPVLADRELELFGPLLLHARIGGIEKRALKVVKAFAGRKLDLQGQEQDFSLARELCEALIEFEGERFSCKELLGRLQDKESWGTRLAQAKNPKAAVTSIGAFLGRFNLPSREHARTGTTYEKAETIEKVSSYLRDSEDTGVAGVTSPTTQSKSTASERDTPDETSAVKQEGVTTEVAETEEPNCPVTPVTPKMRDTGADLSEGSEDEPLRDTNDEEVEL